MKMIRGDLHVKPVETNRHERVCELQIGDGAEDARSTRSAEMNGVRSKVNENTTARGMNAHSAVRVFGKRARDREPRRVAQSPSLRRRRH